MCVSSRRLFRSKVPFARWCRAGKQPSGALEHRPAPPASYDVIVAHAQTVRGIRQAIVPCVATKRAQFFGEPNATATKGSFDVLKDKLAATRSRSRWHSPLGQSWEPHARQRREEHPDPSRSTQRAALSKRRFAAVLANEVEHQTWLLSLGEAKGGPRPSLLKEERRLDVGAEEQCYRRKGGRRLPFVESRR